MSQFDHPCKQTCSGWQQGYEAGRASVKESLLILARAALAQLEVSSSDRSAIASIVWRPNEDATKEDLLKGILAINKIVFDTIENQPKWNHITEAIKEVKSRGDYPLEEE